MRIKIECFYIVGFRAKWSWKIHSFKKAFDEFQEELYFSISSTTRLSREGEQHGVDYYFITHDEFQQGIDKEQFLEWAKVHENFTALRLSIHKML